MPDIVVNARFLTQKITGVQRFAIEMSKSLKSLLPKVKFVSPPEIIHQELAAYLEVDAFGKLSSHFWEQFELPIYLKKNNNPLLINFSNTAPLLYRKQFVTIHDLSFIINPAWFSKSFYLFYSFLIPKIARNSIQVITVSESSKKDIHHLLGINLSKIEVIYNSISTDFKNSYQFEGKNRYGKYILAVSSLDPRKNFIKLIQAFTLAELTDTRLVIVGSENKVFSDQNIKEIIQNNQSIILTGYVSDAELVNLYKHALLFVYPTLYEGFGIPPLEAMACSCPTIVSNTASLPEVCGEASYYIDPNDIHSIVQGITKLTRDENLRRELISRGLKRVELFDWETSRNKLINLIHAL